MNRSRTEQSNEMALLLEFYSVHNDSLRIVLLSNLPLVIFIICDWGQRFTLGSMIINNSNKILKDSALFTLFGINKNSHTPLNY